MGVNVPVIAGRVYTFSIVPMALPAAPRCSGAGTSDCRPPSNCRRLRMFAGRGVADAGHARSPGWLAPIVYIGAETRLQSGGSILVATFPDRVVYPKFTRPRRGAPRAGSNSSGECGWPVNPRVADC